MQTPEPTAACGYQGFGSGDNPSGPGCVKPKGHDGPCGTSAATTEPKLARYRMTVIFKAEDDGEAEIAEEKANDKLASFNYPVIDSRLEKLL